MPRKIIHSSLATLALLIAGLLPRASIAATLEVPVSLDYGIVAGALSDQVFTGPDDTIEVFADRIRCNTLVLSNPRVAGGDDGRLRVAIDMQAQAGTPLAGKCRFAKRWHGIVETSQTAHVEPGSSVIAFRVVDSRLLSAEDGKDVLPRFIQRWIRDYVHPRLGRVRIDLAPATDGIRDLMDMALVVPESVAAAPLPESPWSVGLAAVHPSPEALIATLSLDVPDAPPDWTPADQPPLTEDELAAWDAHWQAWDAFATWMIKTLAEPAGPELTRALAATLLEARYELRDALARELRDRDPVRELFLKTWTRLAPLLHDADLPVPGGQALRYAMFVSAADALQALDGLAPHLGVSIDQDALRSLARMLVPTVTDYDLRYDMAVDPELRALLGLEPELEGAPLPPDTLDGASGTDGAALRLLDWLVPSALAAQIDPQLVRRLNSWAPQRRDVDTYLQTMARLLDAIADAEHDKGKVPSRFIEIYDPLLRATAWQESCWRQYVERDGELETIRSAAGSVGLMQINVHVWRGVYDIDRVVNNVGYNAVAGNEILVHYLVDYAIRKKEHEITGDPDNLARAAYAMYNGGPRHLARYRQGGTSAYLKQIDTAFWEKYKAIQKQGPSAVRPCLAG